MLLTAILLSSLAADPVPGEAEADTRPRYAWGIGAQAELLGPSASLSGVLVSYDATAFQAEAAVVMGIFEEGLHAAEQTDTYALSLRVYYTVHRARSADFSLGIGGGVALLKEPQVPAAMAATAIAGARVRIFVASNACITGSIGVGGFVREGGSVLLLAARPLGSAGFVYYFY